MVNCFTLILLLLWVANMSKMLINIKGKNMKELIDNCDLWYIFVIVIRVYNIYIMNNTQNNRRNHHSVSFQQPLLRPTSDRG